MALVSSNAMMRARPYDIISISSSSSDDEDEREGEVEVEVEGLNVLNVLDEEVLDNGEDLFEAFPFDLPPSPPPPPPAAQPTSASGSTSKIPLQFPSTPPPDPPTTHKDKGKGKGKQKAPAPPPPENDIIMIDGEEYHDALTHSEIKSDIESQLLAEIFSIIPDVSPEYALGLIQKQRFMDIENGIGGAGGLGEGEVGISVVQRVLDKLFEDPGYPRMPPPPPPATSTSATSTTASSNVATTTSTTGEKRKREDEPPSTSDKHRRLTPLPPSSSTPTIDYKSPNRAHPSTPPIHIPLPLLPLHFLSLHTQTPHPLHILRQQSILRDYTSRT